jgi:hypothetical protein
MRALVVTAVLGIGTALVFGAAALTATLFPNGTTVAAGWNGGWMTKEAIPVPAPAIEVAPLGVDDSGIFVDRSGGIVVTREFKALPGDTTFSEPWPATPAPAP